MSVLPAHLVFPYFYSVAPTPAFILPQAQGGLVLVGAGQNDGGVRSPHTWASSAYVSHL